jgi:CRISPR-associated protein Cmr2
MSTQSLLLITIGPVQEFIAAARRSRDLWFGSWLLSELSKAAAVAVIERQGAAGLIFPAPADGEGQAPPAPAQPQGCLRRLVLPRLGRAQPPTGGGLASRASLDALAPGGERSVANKLVVLVAQGSAADTADAARAAIDRRLLAIWNQAFAPLRDLQLDMAVAEAQRDDLVEFSWAALPLRSAAAYGQTRAELEALLAARKASRSFRPVPWSQERPRDKCSLDGLRESVITAPLGTLSEEELYHSYGLRRGEDLSGIGLLKRSGFRSRGASEDGEREGFFSTSHVAALPILQRLDARHQGAVEHYIKALRTAGVRPQALGRVPGAPNGPFGSYDGHLLFEERLAEYVLPRADLPASERALEHRMRLEGARLALRRLLEAVYGRPAPTPCPYYALLRADGDGMGRAIDAQHSVEAHRGLSRALDGFAAQVRRIVGEHHGSLVYAGGDDLLAFLPLHTAIGCAATLAERFRTAMAGFPYAASGAAPTLSVGVAIAHHMEPLSDALAYAQEAERAAKALPGKDALAVSLSARSGVDRRVRGGWTATVAGMNLAQRLGRFAAGYAAGAIPDGLAFEWAALQRRLQSDDAQLAPLLLEPLRLEARRILERKRGEAGDRLSPQVHAMLEALARQAALSDGPGALTLGQLADEMIIARTLAEALRLRAATEALP